MPDPVTARLSSARRGCEVRVEDRHRAVHRGRGQLVAADRRQIDDAGFDAITGNGGHGARYVGAVHGTDLYAAGKWCVQYFWACFLIPDGYKTSAIDAKYCVAPYLF
ncbi:hypothetical protein BCEN4_1580032 [Burkholderia cenocepacia]|nr:hypothetical protein BCEN4_1580032 [Burkholderia cenocepacia]